MSLFNIPSMLRSDKHNTRTGFFYFLDLCFLGMVLIYREEDEARKKDLESKFKNENFPTFLKNMETLLVTRGGKHFAGSEVLCFVLD